MPEGGSAAVAVQEALGCVGIVGHDPGREARGLLVGQPHGLVEVVDDVQGHGRHALGVVRPFESEPAVERENAVARGFDRALRAAHLHPLRPEDGEQLREELLGLAVDEREVEPVADAEPVEHGLGHLQGALALRGRMDVEDTASLRVRKRADSVLGRQLRELGGRRAAPAEDDERDALRHRHEHPGPLSIGRADEPDGAGRQAGSLEGGAQDVVHEHGHRAQRGSACAEHGRVQALQELAGDVQSDVRSGFEVRADDADRDPTLRDLETVLQRPGRDLALERLDRRDGLDLLRQGVDTRAVQAQTVDHPVVEPVLGGFDIGFVGREDLVRSLPNERGRLAQRGCDGLVAQLGRRASGSERLLLDQPAQVVVHVAPASARRASGLSGAARPSASTWTTVWRPRMETSPSWRISQP